MIKKLKSQDIAKLLNAEGHIGSPDILLDEVLFDTRRITNPESSIFFALLGHRDGHEFIEEAYRKEVRAFVISKNLSEYKKKFPDGNFLLVGDVLDALQNFAGKQRKDANTTKFIGITGSNGKTIVKEWLWNILSSRFDAFKNPKSFNSQIGLPLSILSMKASPEYGIFEAGISQTGEMENLERVLEPEIGIFTTLGPAHREGFESDTEKLKEKLGLFKNSELLIARIDRPYSRQIEENFDQKRLVSWGESGDPKYKVSFDKKSGRSSHIIIGEEIFEFSLWDDGSLENITHCIVLAMELGVEPEEIRDSLLEITGVSMRMDIKKGYNNCWLINDSYNLDPDGLMVGLQTLGSLNYSKDRSLVMTDIPGISSQDQWEPIIKRINQENLKHFVGIGTELEKVKNQINAGKTIILPSNKDLSALPNFENETILLTGARKFELEELVPFLEDRVHGTVLEIDLESVVHNLRLFQRLAGNSKIMVMVKGSGYGIGMTELAKFLDSRVDYFGVAYLDEGIDLIRAGIQTPIMVMNPAKEGLRLLVQNKLEAEIYDWDGFEEIKKIAREKNMVPAIHINIDTGMHRLGFEPEDSRKLAQELKQSGILPKSIFSHLSSADEDIERDFTKEQIQRFENAADQIMEVLGEKIPKHICNTAGLINYQEAHFDMSRLGIGLYGIDPTGKIQNRLAPVARLSTEISQIRSLKKGSSIGYGRRGRLEKDGNIATLPIGYADGFPRLLGNGKSKVYIYERPYPVIGNVCMDMIMVDLGQDYYPAGTPVEIFGKEFSLNEFADAQGTIPYEVLTQIGPRVKRIYISSH